MIRECPHCHQKNRVPEKRLADAGKCGGCKSTLPPVSTPLDVDADRFKAIVTQARVPVLVDFWASWCGPCRAAAPEIAQAAKQLAGRALILKVNTEQESQLAAQFGVRSIPNFKLFVAGEMRWEQAGLLSSGQIQQVVQQYMQ